MYKMGKEYIFKYVIENRNNHKKYEHFQRIYTRYYVDHNRWIYKTVFEKIARQHNFGNWKLLSISIVDETEV